MNPFLLSLAWAVASGISGVAAFLLQDIVRTTPYNNFLKRLDQILPGNPKSTLPLESQLDDAVEQLTKASQHVGDILSEVQVEVDRRRQEATSLRTLVDELRKEYDADRSLVDLTAEQAGAIRYLLSKEVSLLKRKSYVPDILVNFGVGTFFFTLGIVVSHLGK